MEGAPEAAVPSEGAPDGETDPAADGAPDGDNDPSSWRARRSPSAVSAADGVAEAVTVGRADETADGAADGVRDNESSDKILDSLFTTGATAPWAVVEERRSSAATAVRNNILNVAVDCVLSFCSRCRSRSRSRAE